MNTIFLLIKKYKILAIVILCIIVLIFLVALLSPSDKTLSYTVKPENLVNTVLVNGTYTTASQTQVTSPTNGTITKLYIANGDTVKKNDPLFHVESTATADQQKAAYAAYLAASSAVQADTAMLYTLQSAMYSAWDTYTSLSTTSTYQNSDGSPNNTNRVLPAFTTAQDNWLAAEANYKNQQAVIGKDQAALASASLSYKETQSVTVTAPASGKIINLSVKTNDQISTPVQSSAGQTITSPVLIIADFSNPLVTSAVDQVNIPRIAIGQKAQVVFDALPDQTFHGTVETIDTAGTKTQGTVTYNVGIVVTDISPEIKPNMTGSITIETARKEHILTVPNDAIIRNNGKTFVQKTGSKRNDLTEVVLGLKGITKTEVVAGLTAGDKVVEQEE